MIMRDSEIKNLFAKADEQVHVDEIRKQKTYYAMVEEMEKQRTPMMSTKNILFHQFWYMDKLFFAVYGVLICLGIIFITALQYTGLNQNGMITVCMVGAGILSITSISVIDKLFFGKMAELGESCYFNTKQCVAAWLVLSGMINVMILFLIAGYLNYHWSVGLLQVGLYILTPYLVSSIKYNCIRNFINGNKRKEFIFIWHECHLFINKLWSNRFDSESTFCNNSLDMGSSFSCVGTFICNADKKIA